MLCNSARLYVDSLGGGGVFAQKFVHVINQCFLSIPKCGLGKIPFSTNSSLAFLVDNFLSRTEKQQLCLYLLSNYRKL